MYTYPSKLNTPKWFSSSSMSLHKLSRTESCCRSSWIPVLSSRPYYVYFIYLFFLNGLKKQKEQLSFAAAAERSQTTSLSFFNSALPDLLASLKEATLSPSSCLVTANHKFGLLSASADNSNKTSKRSHCLFRKYSPCQQRLASLTAYQLINSQDCSQQEQGRREGHFCSVQGEEMSISPLQGRGASEQINDVVTQS